MRVAWRRLRRSIAAIGGYKAVWNYHARHNARDAIFAGSTEASFEEAGRRDAERIRAIAGPGARVLNIGCGIGRVEKYLAPQVVEMHAVDISGEMIARARVRLSELRNVSLREVTPIEFLAAYPAGKFDLVFSLLVLQHLEKEDAFLYLEDARRVLRSGGSLFVQFPNLLSPEYTQSFRDVLRNRPRSPGRVRPYTEGELRYWMEMLELDVVSLSIEAGARGNAEIYLTARKP
jgi:cyclopropane fatty-acyl-phospholipid synthase-like methyltransferase